MAEEKTFMRITNRDIYDKIEQLENKNDSAHLDILLHQQQTNGKVKLNRWIASTAIMGLFTLAGWFLTHISRAS